MKSVVKIKSKALCFPSQDNYYLEFSEYPYTFSYTNTKKYVCAYLFLVKMLQKGRKNGTNSVKQTKIFCKILVRKYELDNLCE